METQNPFLADTIREYVKDAVQPYNGFYQSAAPAFALNGISLASTAPFAEHNLDAAAIASGLVFSVTYLGNILSAVRGAKQVNKAHVESYDNRKMEELFPEMKLAPIQ